MKTIKFRNDRKALITENIDGVEYKTVWRPYTVSELPSDFGTLDGVNEWFSYKGFTYIQQ